MIDEYDKKFISEMAIGILDELKQLSEAFCGKFTESLDELDDTIEYLAIKVQELKEEIRAQRPYRDDARNGD